ncbi:hypothetical protein BKA56DRAFT_631956 [Ilyonectria sp. MPI-CAGE-AT-0026]|nr:hypothetical protein BKA56DRAFT_631956 [Ilyonectria sp. MPI-CAGE-AT-0026]
MSASGSELHDAMQHHYTSQGRQCGICGRRVLGSAWHLSRHVATRHTGASHVLALAKDETHEAADLELARQMMRSTPARLRHHGGVFAKGPLAGCRVAGLPRYFHNNGRLKECYTYLKSDKPDGRRTLRRKRHAPSHPNMSWMERDEGGSPLLPFTEIQANLWTPSKFDNWRGPFRIDAQKEDPSRVASGDKQCELCSGSFCDCITTRIRPGPCPRVVPSDNIGDGVQASQRYEAGDLMGEFVGELAPLDHYDDGYAAELHRYDLVSSGRGVAACTIHPRHYGNWSRKVNHACEPNACLESMKVSGRWRIMIKAVKDIKPGSWVEIDYGRSYWSQSPEPCRCGIERCYSRET